MLEVCEENVLAVEKQLISQSNPNENKEIAQISVFTKQILEKQNNWGDYSPITCNAYLRCSKCQKWTYKIHCLVACGHWHMLQLTDQEKADFKRNERTATINLMDHFGELVPNQLINGKVGLVTYQNGINNKFKKNFEEMGAWINSNFPEGPLSIGLYNHTETIVIDICRLQLELFGFKTEIVRNTTKMFTTLAKRLLKTTPHPCWIHIAHSEAGRIADLSLEQMQNETLAYCLEHLIVATYGAVKPVPKKAAKLTINTYSKKDIAYWQYGEIFEGRKNHYEIKIVDSLVDKKNRNLIAGDHGFLEETYKDALTENIKNFKKLYGIYNGKN